MRRVQNEPAWLLHHRPYRDTSRIVDILSREHGRMSLVARGSRTAKSRLAGILRPFLPLQLSWVIRSDLGTLTGAEMLGQPIALGGDALLSGYYVNELLLHLLHRHDPQPEIFAAYSRTIERLQVDRNVPTVLRAFEIELLRLLGYALNLDHDAETQSPLVAESWYEYRTEQGPVAALDRDGPMVFSGAQLIGIRTRDFADNDVVLAAGKLLRHVIAFHLDGRELKTRRVLVDIRRTADNQPKHGR